MENITLYAKLKHNLHLNLTEAKLKTVGKSIYLGLTALAIINLAALLALWMHLTFHPSLLLILLSIICSQFINRHATTALYQETRNRAKVLLAGSATALTATSCNLLSMWLDIGAQDNLQMHNFRPLTFSFFIFASSLVILPCINLSLKSFSKRAQKLTEHYGNAPAYIGQQLFISLHLFILVPGTAILLFLQPPQNSFAALNLIGFCLMAFILLIVYRQRLWYQPLLSKTQIFVPWAIYFFPYCFLLTQYAGHFWLFYLPTNLSQPGVIPTGTTQTIEISFVSLIIIDLLTALVLIRGLNFRWRKRLNDVEVDYLEEQNFVDHQDYANTIYNYIRLTGDNAVIGITGVQGAGKSALMNQVSHQLSRDYKVIQLTAPNETKDMDFLVSLCRNLCQSVIRSTRYLLFDDQNPEQQSRIQTSRKLSLLFGLVLTLGIAFLLYFKHKEDNNFSYVQRQQTENMLSILQDLPTIFFDNALSAQTSAQSELEDNTSYISFIQDNLSKKFRFITQQEQDITDNLLRQVKQFAPQSKWAQGQKIQLNFGTPGLGYSLNIMQSTRVYKDEQPGVMNYEQMEEELLSNTELEISYLDLNYDFHDFNDEIDEQQEPYTEQALWPYIHYVLTGRPNLELQPQNSIYFPYNISVLDLITNHVLITNFEAKLLNLKEFSQISQDFRALIGMHDYVKDYQQKPAHYLLTWILAETLATNKRALVFNQAQFQRFELLLIQYQSLLKNSKRQSVEQLDSKRLTAKYWYEQLRAASPLKNAPHLEFFIAFLVVMLWIGPFLWRYLDQFFRALANPAALALLREAEQFLDTLSYKSDFGQSAGVANSWFSFSRSVNKQERELNLSTVTNLFSNFAQVLTEHYGGKLIIVIDELDKIQDLKQVEALLNELKGVLAVPNCYYLIALSEDCAQSFRQRQTGGHDIFESNFDEVFHVTQINVQSIEYLVSNLAIEQYQHKLPPLGSTSYSIIYLFSAGIAREIMRTLKLIYSDKNLCNDLSDTCIANYLLQKAWQDWRFELEELPIDGQTMAHLFRLTHECGTDFDYQALNQDIQAIDKAINTLDNNNKRQTILWNEADSDNPQIAQFKARIGATRSLIKLKLMTLLNLWVQNGQLATLTIKQHKKIAECFNQTEQQPYLAETLIGQLISQIPTEK